MKRSLLGWFAAFALALGGTALAWLWFAGGSGEPSTELTTPTIASEPETTSSADVESTTSESTSTTGPGTEPMAFVIDPERSTASFEIDEELRGSPKRVVGTTSELAGQVLVDIADLSAAQFSEMIINARTFQTDSSQRDRAIRGPIILDSASDEFEFITLSVTSVDGLQETLNIGDTIEFILTGDLTVKGTTREEAFEVTATLVDQVTIEGNAATTVSRGAYGIGIPSVPGVANVGDEVELKLDFVMTAS